MTIISAGASPITPPRTTAATGDAQAKLKKTAFQMEGMFVQKLFAAMRDTVPQDGLVPQGDGESTFTTMLDEKMAEQVPKQWTGEHSLAQALYKQLSRQLKKPDAAPTETATK